MQKKESKTDVKQFTAERPAGFNTLGNSTHRDTVFAVTVENNSTCWYVNTEKPVAAPTNVAELTTLSGRLTLWPLTDAQLSAGFQEFKNDTTTLDKIGKAAQDNRNFGTFMQAVGFFVNAFTLGRIHEFLNWGTEIKLDAAKIDEALANLDALNPVSEEAIAKRASGGISTTSKEAMVLFFMILDNAKILSENVEINKSDKDKPKECEADLSPKTKRAP
jgi:hypothetical protein